MNKKEFEKEMVRRGYHVTPRRCSTCGGNHPLLHDSEFRLYCKGCGRLEKECNC